MLRVDPGILRALTEAAKDAVTYDTIATVLAGPDTATNTAAEEQRDALLTALRLRPSGTGRAQDFTGMNFGNPHKARPESLAEVTAAAGVTSLTRTEAPGRADFTHPVRCTPRVRPRRGPRPAVDASWSSVEQPRWPPLPWPALSPSPTAPRTRQTATRRHGPPVASSPHPEADSPGTPAPGRKATTTVAAASTTRDASAGQLPARASGHSSGSSFVAPSREQVAGTAAHGPASPPPPSIAGGASKDRGGKPHPPQSHAKPQTQASGERSHKAREDKASGQGQEEEITICGSSTARRSEGSSRPDRAVTAPDLRYLGAGAAAVLVGVQQCLKGSAPGAAGAEEVAPVGATVPPGAGSCR